MPVTPRARQVLTTVGTLVALLALAWLQSQGHLGGGPTTSAPAGRPTTTGPYAPSGPEQALPGGSLKAHEARGGHTLARHVGRTHEQLRERLRNEQKSEVSTFDDLAGAERWVARALYEQRSAVSAWLAAGAWTDMAVTWRAGEVVGQVLRAGAAEPVPGHTVHVVLYVSKRFPEGFAVRTAYVRLP